MATISAAPPTIPRNELNFVKPIGEGGFSSVYQMTWMHPSLGPIEIAAKKLNRHDVTELNIMSDLDHPNIVKLLGVVDEPMDFMLILELCERGSLRSYLKELNGQRLSDEQFRDWAEQAARPLKYLRERNIIHKDVKSPNYMITADNNLKLGDFGIAKNLADTTYHATTSASYPWMAPELLRDAILSPKYDIFAYGVIVWELRTGKCPFEGLESQVVAWRVCHENQRLPIPEDCPQPIKDLMMRCWESDWRKRPDVDEVLEMIKGASEVGTTATATSTSSPSSSATTTPSSTSSSATTSSTDSSTKHILNGWWILEREFGYKDGPGKLNFAGGITVNPINRDIALSTKSSRSVNMYTINGDYKSSMDTTHGLQPVQSFPRQVAVNSQGNTYFVTDKSSYVNCFNSDGQPKGQWVSSCPQVPYPPSLYGLAIDHDGHVLLGDIENDYIYKHKQDGTYLSSIKLEVEPLFIAATSLGTIVVAQRYTPPHIILSNARPITLKHPVHNAQWNTEGVCVHEDNILIADGATNSILCYSTSGNYQYLGTPIPDIPNPRGDAMTADGGKLVVAGKDKLSYGYGGTGQKSCWDVFRTYGKKFGKGDVITCYIDFTGKFPIISYAKNGEECGLAHSIKDDLQGRALYPHVLMKNAAVEVNLGQKKPSCAVKKGFTFVRNLPEKDCVFGPQPPASKHECEVLMMIGLSGSGKTTWAKKHCKANPDKHFVILGTNQLIDEMKYPDLNHEYSERWKQLFKPANECYEKLLEMASKTRHNYILDQTNLYPIARKRKIRWFEDFTCKAVVVVPPRATHEERSKKLILHDQRTGIPEKDIRKMKADFKLPDEREIPDLFTEAQYVELQHDEASSLLDEYKEEVLLAS